MRHTDREYEIDPDTGHHILRPRTPLCPPIYPRADKDNHLLFGPRPMGELTSREPGQEWRDDYNQGWSDRGRADKRTRWILAIFAVAMAALALAIVFAPRIR